jgi:hypothetical protein
MRTTTATVTLAASTALIGLATSPATATATAETVREKGIVLECTGSASGLDAYVNVYENDPYGNYVQVVLDDDPERATSREPVDVWRRGEVRVSVRIDGRRALVTGTATKARTATRVHEEHDDAGQHIVADGVHRRLRTDLALHYAGTAVPLTCDPGFFYRLDVTKTDTTGD